MASVLGHDLPLGRKVDYVTTYTPSLLRSVSRSDAREALGIEDSPPFLGEDVWTCYEFSWLNTNGRPDAAVLQLQVPANSTHMVESKSLKLYLTSFAQTPFVNRAELLRTLDSDLALAFRAPVMVSMLGVDQVPEPVAHLPGRTLDALDIAVSTYAYDPELLILEDATVSVRETLHTNLFRSVCPVTGQPDWASMMIQYVGPAISHEALLRYLISYRTHAAFHEATVEQIFVDIQRRCVPDQLTVFGRFLRRGGIDINPFRSTTEPQAPGIRLLRQ